MEFKRLLSGFLRRDVFNVGPVRTLDAKPVVDLCTHMAEQGLHHEWIMSGASFENDEQGSPGRVGDLIEDAKRRGYRVMILRIEPCLADSAELNKEFGRVYRRRFPNPAVTFRARPDKLLHISRFENDSASPIGKFKRLFANRASRPAQRSSVGSGRG